MPPPGPREQTGNLCVWLISFIFFLLLVAGGGLLVLYMVLPESPETTWFPAGGMILVGIPWAFWIMTCLYISMKPKAGAQRFNAATVAPVPITPTASAAADRNETSPVNNSPRGGRNNNPAFTTEEDNAESRNEADEDSPAAATSNARHAMGSSRESEAPLASSM